MTRVGPGEALLQSIERGLDQPARSILAALVSAAECQGLSLFVVGGVLRDLLREPARPGRRAEGAAPRSDLDLAIEGDPGAIVSDVGERLSAGVVLHDRFGTARLRLGGATVDLARTRRERYPRAGALPIVEPAAIEADLGRRDFTLNAMALGLSGSRRGVLLDPYGGAADLERGLIRTLHERSFRDDPTRLIRACRYAARIGGRFAPGTGAEARASLRYLPALSADRFAEAWRRLLRDDAAAGALRRAAALRLTEARQPGWALPARLLRAFAADDVYPEGVHANGGDPDLVHPEGGFWALTGLSAPAEVSARLPRSGSLTREERRALDDGTALRTKRRALGGGGLPNSDAAELLRPHGEASLGAAARLWRGRAGIRAGRALGEWGRVESPIGAGELIALGVPEGSETGIWLRDLRDAVIDGGLPPGRRGAAAARRLVRQRLHSSGFSESARPRRGRDEGRRRQ